MIRKDDDYKPSRPEGRTPPCEPSVSPNITVGSPSSPSSPPLNPYSNLFNSGLYQQYLTQLLASSGVSTPINPMFLQAQLAMAAQSNHAHLLANYSGSASSLISERLKQNRYSPYSPVSNINPTSHHLLSASQPSLTSAFKSLSRQFPASPPVSPPHSVTPPPMDTSPPSLDSPVTIKAELDPSEPVPSEIKSIENMINGLNGNSEGRFGLSHDSRIS